MLDIDKAISSIDKLLSSFGIPLREPSKYELNEISLEGDLSSSDFINIRLTPFIDAFELELADKIVDSVRLGEDITEPIDIDYTLLMEEVTSAIAKVLENKGVIIDSTISNWVVGKARLYTEKIIADAKLRVMGPLFDWSIKNNKIRLFYQKDNSYRFSAHDEYWEQEDAYRNEAGSSITDGMDYASQSSEQFEPGAVNAAEAMGKTNKGEVAGLIVTPPAARQKKKYDEAVKELEDKGMLDAMRKYARDIKTVKMDRYITAIREAELRLQNNPAFYMEPIVIPRLRTSTEDMDGIFADEINKREIMTYAVDNDMTLKSLYESGPVGKQKVEHFVKTVYTTRSNSLRELDAILDEFKNIVYRQTALKGSIKDMFPSLDIAKSTLAAIDVNENPTIEVFNFKEGEWVTVNTKLYKRRVLGKKMSHGEELKIDKGKDLHKNYRELNSELTKIKKEFDARETLGAYDDDEERAALQFKNRVKIWANMTDEQLDAQDPSHNEKRAAQLYREMNKINTDENFIAYMQFADPKLSGTWIAKDGVMDAATYGDHGGKSLINYIQTVNALPSGADLENKRLARSNVLGNKIAEIKTSIGNSQEAMKQLNYEGSDIEKQRLQKGIKDAQDRLAQYEEMAKPENIDDYIRSNEKASIFSIKNDLVEITRMTTDPKTKKGLQAGTANINQMLSDISGAYGSLCSLEAKSFIPRFVYSTGDDALTLTKDAAVAKLEDYRSKYDAVTNRYKALKIHTKDMFMPKYGESMQTYGKLAEEKRKSEAKVETLRGFFANSSIPDYEEKAIMYHDISKRINRGEVVSIDELNMRQALAPEVNGAPKDFESIFKNIRVENKKVETITSQMDAILGPASDNLRYLYQVHDEMNMLRSQAENYRADISKLSNIIDKYNVVDDLRRHGGVLIPKNAKDSMQTMEELTEAMRLQYEQGKNSKAIDYSRRMKGFYSPKFRGRMSAPEGYGEKAVKAIQMGDPVAFSSIIRPDKVKDKTFIKSLTASGKMSSTVGEALNQNKGMFGNYLSSSYYDTILNHNMIEALARNNIDGQGKFVVTAENAADNILPHLPPERIANPDVITRTRRVVTVIGGGGNNPPGGGPPRPPANGLEDLANKTSSLADAVNALRGYSNQVPRGAMEGMLQKHGWQITAGILGGIGVAGLMAVWDPNKHPRDDRGRFRQNFGRSPYAQTPIY